MRNSGFDSTRGDQPAFDELAHTDLLLDALAARTETRLSDPNHLDDQALAALLGDWRDDLRWPPASALVSQDEAEQALRDGMLNRRGARRGLASVGSVAATLLLLSGFGAVIADAKPGDLLYGLHAMMFNEPRVSDDQIMLSAKADLAKVEEMIAQGQWDRAHTQLAEVSSTLQGVNDGSRRQGLLDEVTQLNTKVEKRDPQATLPAAPPNTEPIGPGAPANSWTQPSLAPTPALTEPATTTASPSPTTTAEPTPTTSTSKPNASETTPSPTTTPTPTPSSKATPQPSTSATPGAKPNSPAAGPSSPAPSTSSGELWDRTSGPATPKTPFPTSSRP